MKRFRIREGSDEIEEDECFGGFALQDRIGGFALHGFLENLDLYQRELLLDIESDKNGYYKNLLFSRGCSPGLGLLQQRQRQAGGDLDIIFHNNRGALDLIFILAGASGSSTAGLSPPGPWL